MRRWALVFLLLIATGVSAAQVNTPAEGGLRLAAFLDALDVEQRWLPNTHVDWQTGLRDESQTSDTRKTYCSAFVAAAASQLGVYILRPPEHNLWLLANAQYEWLTGPGRSEGWKPLPNAREAQQRAIRGELVVAVYKNPNPQKPGHIAIVRPTPKPLPKLLAEGPDVIQAGKFNFRATSLKKGFDRHPGAFEAGKIRFFAHPTPLG